MSDIKNFIPDFFPKIKIYKNTIEIKSSLSTVGVIIFACAYIFLFAIIIRLLIPLYLTNPGGAISVGLLMPLLLALGYFLLKLTGTLRISFPNAVYISPAIGSDTKYHIDEMELYIKRSIAHTRSGGAVTYTLQANIKETAFILDYDSSHHLKSKPEKISKEKMEILASFLNESIDKRAPQNWDKIRAPMQYERLIYLRDYGHPKTTIGKIVAYILSLFKMAVYFICAAFVLLIIYILFFR
jgi:hypothetical protein